MLYFTGIIFIFGLRLWIWKLFPGLESGIKDDLSNMIIASLIFGLAMFFFARRAVHAQGFSKSGLEGPIALFIAAAAWSSFWTVDMASTVRAILMLLAYVFFFFILLQTLVREQQRRIFLWVFLIGSIVVAGFGINDIIVLNRVSPEALESARLTNKSLYYILTHKRACSLFGWPNVMAGFLMLSMPLAVALFMSVRSWWLKAIAGVGVVMMVVAFYFSFSFLGWSGFMITSAVCFFVLIQRRIVVMPVLLARYSLLGIVLVALLFTGVVLKKNFGESMAPRKEYARVVRSVITEHPFLGTGFGAYRYASMKFVVSNEGETAFPHNTYAQVWAETGLPGLAAVLWLIVAAFFLAQGIIRRIGEGKDKMVFLAVLVGLAAFFVDNINSFTMLKPNISFFFWVWLALFCSYGLEGGAVLSSSIKLRRIVMIVFTVVAAAGLFLSARFALSLSNLRIGQEAVQAGVFDLGQNFFERAHALDPLNPYVLSVEGDLYLRRFRSTGSASWLDQAEKVFLQAADRAPNYYYNYLALASIYNSRGDRIRTEAAVARARAVSPYETERDLQASSHQK